MTFWIRFDELLATHEIIIDRPKGTAHPRHPGLIYPLDYGYLKGTSAGDGDGIDIWHGSLKPVELVAVACTVDTFKKDAEIKLLLGCNEDEIKTVEKVYNDGNKYMSCIIIKRGR